MEITTLTSPENFAWLLLELYFAISTLIDGIL